MVPIFVALTVLFCVALDAWLSHRKSVRVKPGVPAVIPLRVRPGAFLHPGHIWAEIRPFGRVDLGLDGLIAASVGPAKVSVLPSGSRVRRGEPLIWVESKGRRLTVPSPLSGRVERVNGELGQGPMDDWACQIQPDRLGEEIPTFTVGRTPVEYIAAEWRRLAEWLAVRHGEAALSMPDGGQAVRGALSNLSRDDWHDFEVQFIQTPSQAEGSSPDGVDASLGGAAVESPTARRNHLSLPGRLLVIAIASISPQPAGAVTSLSRLYSMGCTACHSTTPRLNYFGEKLMLRGNELDRMSVSDLPKQHDEVPADVSCRSCHNSGRLGEEVGATKASSKLFLHEVGNLFSFRFKLTPLAVETNKLSERGEKKTRITAGKGDWVQFWVAGPVAKDVSVRIEAELTEGKAVGLHNYAVAFSNLLGSPEGIINLRVGGFTHGEWLSISDQKRAFSPHFDLFEFASAKGTGEDTYKVAGAEPGVELYGYKGPFVYQGGLSNGKTSTDVDSDLNYWGTAKLYLATSGTFAGSSVSASYVTGTDCKNAALATMQMDDFWRSIVSAGLRRGPLDLAGAYVWGQDDNWDLTTGLENKFNGGFVQVLYTATDRFTPGVIYQRLSCDDEKFEKHHVLAGLNCYYRQNLFVSAYYDRDLQSTRATHPDELHAFVVQFRGMF